MACGGSGAHGQGMRLCGWGSWPWGLGRMAVALGRARGRHCDERARGGRLAARGGSAAVGCTRVNRSAAQWDNTTVGCMRGGGASEGGLAV